MNNTCSQNNGHGIFAEWSHDSTIVNNVCNQNNGTAIYLWSSDNVVINENLVGENKVYGISLAGYCDNNLIHHNSFLNNKNGSIQANDDGSNNSWYDVVTYEGNYWLDYTGLGSYRINGSAGVTDIYPLADILDFDSDGIEDGREYQIGLNPANPDTDGDRMVDGWEVLMGTNPFTNDADNDPDKDNLINLVEYLQGTDPHNADSDEDGLTDDAEIQMFTTDPLIPDSDADGLLDGVEVYTYTTDPLDPDSDADGLLDGIEVKKYATDPLKPDSDGDGLSDGEEVNNHNTNPTDSDSDNDLFPDGLDYGWWGNPRTPWDNPLTRGLLLSVLLISLGLILWMGYIVRQLPKLEVEIRQQLQHFEQQVKQYHEHVEILNTCDNVLEKIEEEVETIHREFQTIEESIKNVRHLITQKWLPPFLRPDLTPWEILFAAVQHTSEKFQQNRLKRLNDKY
jgi:parallel beta-helix repeat protein